jgi:hypothetical protein
LPGPVPSTCPLWHRLSKCWPGKSRG